MVRDGKGGKGRYTVLSERGLRAVRDYQKRQRLSGPYLFPGRKSGDLVVSLVTRNGDEAPPIETGSPE